MDQPQVTFEIPIWRWKSAVKKRLDALVRRAARKGLTHFEYSTAPETIQKSFTRMVPCTLEDLPMTGDKPEAYNVECVVVTINCPKPSLNGWRFIGRIEHMLDDAKEAINLVYAAPNEEVPAEFYKRDQICEHCNTNRQRRDTFIVAKGDEFKQVGSTCLSDFLGVDAASMLAYAEIIESTLNCCSNPDDWDDAEWGMMRQSRMFAIPRILHAAAAITLGIGYVSRRKADEGFGIMPTAERLRSHLTAKTAQDTIDPKHFTDRSDQLATDTMEWLQDLAIEDLADLDDYLRNLVVVVRVGACPWKAIGILGSACYALMRKREKDQQIADAAVSTHQGAIKERITRNVTVILEKPYSSEFGPGGIIYKFIDDDGNRYLWFASTDKDWGIGKALTIKGTVKGHDTDRFDNCDITRINRVVEVN